MAKRLDTMATAASGGADTLKLVNFPEKFLNFAILIRIFYPTTTVADVGNIAPTTNQIITAALASLSLRYGPGGKKVVYPTVPGAEMRNVSRYASRLECPNNLASISWALGGPATVRLDFLIPFALETQSDGKRRLPGWSQSKGMIIDIVEGTGLSVNAGRTTRTPGNLLFDVDVVTVPSELDQAGPVLSYWRANQSSLRAEGPRVLLAGAWELSAAQASTAITLYSLEVGGIKQEDVIPPYVSGDKYQMLYDTGLSPITDEVTMAFSPLESEPGDEYPIGDVTYELAAQDIPQIQLRGLGWPLESLDEAKDNAKESSKSGPVMAEKADDVVGLTESVAATRPAIMHPPDSARFTLGHGLIAPGGGAEPFLSLPEFKGTVAGATVELAATSGAQSMAAAQSSQLASIVKKTPGLASSVATPNKSATVNATKYVDALKSASGEKGAGPLSSFLKALKL